MRRPNKGRMLADAKKRQPPVSDKGKHKARRVAQTRRVVQAR